MSSSQVLVSKSALIHNIRAYKRVIGDAQLMTVVKSNAYGHGLLEVSKAIEHETNWFGVVSGQEGLELRKAGIKKPILVLSFYQDAEIILAIKNNLSLSVYDLNQARKISVAVKKLNKIAKIHLKLDTGTTRLGVLLKDFPEFLKKVLKLPNLKIEGVFSHFAASEESFEFTKKQLAYFNAAVAELEVEGIKPIKHIACTAAGMVIENASADLVRLGIGLYGLWPSHLAQRKAHALHKNFELRPVLSWITKIIQVKTVAKGTFVGYGLSFQTNKQTTVAVLPVGYYDGYSRKLSNHGEVLIGGKRCKVMGRVCMNLIMVDATKVKNVKAGDSAVLIGKQGKEEITADELAEKIGTINYEVVARINPLIERIVV